MPPFAYLRKSVVKDPTHEVSHEVQLGSVKALAARHGDNGTKLVVLSDWDVSGSAKGLRRRMSGDYGRLLAAIESGECTALYSYSLSRLGRSTQEVLRLFDLCDQHHVPVRLDADPIDTSTAMGKMQLTMVASMAQFESDIASERVSHAIAAMKANGTFVATPGYGDRPGEDLAAVVAAFTEGGSYYRAAQLLNERDVKPRQSTRGWWPSSVREVIRKARPDLIAPRVTRRVAAGGPSFTFARLLRCGTCGTLLTGNRHRGRIRYYCPMFGQPHQRRTISETKLLGAVKDEVGHLNRRKVPKKVAEGKTTNLDARRAKVLDLFEHGEIERPELQRRLERIAAEEREHEDELTIRKVPDVQWDGDPRQLNAILTILFTEIALDPLTFEPVAYGWRRKEWRG